MALTVDRAELIRFAQRDVASGAREDDVVEMLVKNGMEIEDARATVASLRRGPAPLGGPSAVTNDRFPFLSTLSWVLRVLGAVGSFISMAAIGTSLVATFWEDTRQWSLVALAGGLSGLIPSLLLVTFGELIGVLFAIERNTRRP